MVELLSENHYLGLPQSKKKKKLEWALVHSDWTIGDFEKVLRSDKLKFEIFGSKRRVCLPKQQTEDVTRLHFSFSEA